MSASTSGSDMEQTVVVQSLTLSVTARLYFKAAEEGAHRMGGRPKRRSTLSGERARFDTYVEPHLGIQPITELTPEKLSDFLRTTATLLSDSTVTSIARTMSRIFKFASWSGFMSTNPLAGKTPIARLSQQNAAFGVSAIRRVWRRLEQECTCLGDVSVSSSSLRAASIIHGLRFSAITLASFHEVAEARFREIDTVARVWTIPGQRGKSLRRREIPLSDAALDIFFTATRRPFYGTEGERADWPVFQIALERMKPISATILKGRFFEICQDIKIPMTERRYFCSVARTVLMSQFGAPFLKSVECLTDAHKLDIPPIKLRDAVILLKSWETILIV